MNPLRSDFRLIHRLRVRWAEVDMQKIVFNGHYLMYFDTALGDYWRAMALPYEATFAKLGGDLYVKRAGVEYFGSAHYDDLLDIALKCQRVGNTSINFTGAIFCGEKLLVTCDMVYVFADPATQKSKPVPEVLREMLEAYETGQSMTTLQVGDWESVGVLTTPLRDAVFVLEQGIAASLVWDAADSSAVHAVITNRMGEALAAGRTVDVLASPETRIDGAGEGGRNALGTSGVKVGRMAVTRPMRGSALGGKVLQALLTAASLRGRHKAILHAQCSAEEFYLRHGFATHGDVFEEAGIRHIEMEKHLVAAGQPHRD